MTTDAPTLTVAQAAKQLGVRRETVRAWADSTPPKLPSWRTPTGHRKFRQSDIDALLAMGRS